MSRTFKTQRAYQAHHQNFDEYTPGMRLRHVMQDAFRTVGERFGNQRKMRAKLKTLMRRIRRRRDNHFDVDTE